LLPPGTPLLWNLCRHSLHELSHLYTTHCTARRKEKVLAEQGTGGRTQVAGRTHSACPYLFPCPLQKHTSFTSRTISGVRFGEHLRQGRAERARPSTLLPGGCDLRPHPGCRFWKTTGSTTVYSAGRFGDAPVAGRRYCAPSTASAPASPTSCRGASHLSPTPGETGSCRFGRATYCWHGTRTRGLNYALPNAGGAARPRRLPYLPRATAKHHFAH